VYPAALGDRMLPRGLTITLVPSARLALGLVLLLALGLRLWGLSFGLPYVIQPDEPSVENRALQMWLAGNPNPHYFVYPSLYYDLQALWAYATGHVAGLFYPDVLRHPLLHKPLFYLSGRFLTALLGVLTVFVTYLTGRVLSVRLGLMAALFLAVAAQHIQQSHYITVDAPTALFTALTALFALRALHVMRDARVEETARPERRARPYLLAAGVAAGLAAGTKYNAGVALLLPLAAIALGGTGAWTRRLAAAAAVIAVCAVTFLLTSPFILLDPAPFLNSLHVVAQHYATGHPGAEGGNNALWYLLYLAQGGVLPPLTVLTVAGIAVVVARYRRAGLVLLAFTLPYYALLCSTYVRFDRNLLPLLPFVALLAAAGVEPLIARVALLLRNHGAAYGLILGLVVAPSAAVAAQADNGITHPFSEQVAVVWATAHLPRGAHLATENWEGRPFELSPKNFAITHVGALGTLSYDDLRKLGVRYAVTDDWTDGAYLRDPRRYPVEAAHYREIYRRGLLLARIPGGLPQRQGPTMSIYELRP
jgi:4-amino-4-deoxy-L-arabinose transferase-like glycosyltransferase